MSPLRVFSAAALAAGLAASVAAPRLLRSTPQEPVVWRVPVDGTVELGLSPFVGRALREAAAEGAAAVVLDLDTPGGRIDAAWQIIDDVRDAAVPVYAWVDRRALSAGAMIALSARGVWMRSGSTIGAATPVTGQGSKAPEKMVSAMRSEFRALAEAMVDEDVEIPGVVDRGKLLTLTTEEAVRLGVANGEADGWPALMRAIGTDGARVVEARPNWAENVVRFLTHPAVAPLLLSLGFLGLLVEIKTPTFGLAGLTGLLCLGAFFGARLLVNLAGLEELLLLGTGIVLVALEALVIPGFGVAGVLGGAAILGSVTLSMLGSFPTVTDVISALGWIAISVLVVLVFAFGILRHLPHSRSLSGIFLKDSTSRDVGYLSAPDRADLVGRVGVALTDLRPSGTALIEEERVDVMTEGPWVEQGTPVVVVRARSFDIVVRPAPPSGEAGRSQDTPGA